MASASRALLLSRALRAGRRVPTLLRPLAASASLLPAGAGASAPGAVVRCFATQPATSSLRDSSPNWSNRLPKETILLEGCDFEHWLVVMEPPPEVPKVRWVLPDSYLHVKTKDYGGEPFINGEALPYDPKYHEEWVRNNARANERIRRNDRPRNDRSRNFERRGNMQNYQNRSTNFERRENMQKYQNRDGPPAQGFNGPPPPPGQNQMPPHHGQGNMPPSPPPHAGGGQPNYQPQMPNTEAGYYQQGGAPGYQGGNQGYQGNPGPAYQGGNPGYQGGPPGYPGGNSAPPNQGGNPNAPPYLGGGNSGFPGGGRGYQGQ
ncbi:unnamed protein product [Miscanthus lutarioriparius]|uniref:Uncharacterized protein n=1 Tax=Miscanthus lutarioriparius TaxID=422564 RepID=A0A811MSM9_9POAL|nr:unnamed protein product [Miscanthus lutarioriparius]